MPPIVVADQKSLENALRSYYIYALYSGQYRRCVIVYTFKIIFQRHLRAYRPDMIFTYLCTDKKQRKRVIFSFFLKMLFHLKTNTDCLKKSRRCAIILTSTRHVH